MDGWMDGPPVKSLRSSPPIITRVTSPHIAASKSSVHLHFACRPLLHTRCEKPTGPRRSGSLPNSMCMSTSAPRPTDVPVLSCIACCCPESQSWASLAASLSVRPSQPSVLTTPSECAHASFAPVRLHARLCFSSLSVVLHAPNKRRVLDASARVTQARNGPVVAESHELVLRRLGQHRSFNVRVLWRL